MENVKSNKKLDVRRLVFSALMGALSIVLAELPFLKITTPIPFIKLDFSDVPAMLASLTMGPVSGVFVCVIKNAWGCLTTSTGCVGELQNLILSVSLVLPAGLLAHKNSSVKRAIFGSLAGSAAMAAISFPANYFIMFPVYSTVFKMPMEAIIGIYQKVFPHVETLGDCLLTFNVPFTFAKGLIASVISVALYKKLRPVFNSVYLLKNS